MVDTEKHTLQVRTRPTSFGKGCLMAERPILRAGATTGRPLPFLGERGLVRTKKHARRVWQRPASLGGGGGVCRPSERGCVLERNLPLADDGSTSSFFRECRLKHALPPPPVHGAPIPPLRCVWSPAPRAAAARPSRSRAGCRATTSCTGASCRWGGGGRGGGGGGRGVYEELGDHCFTASRVGPTKSKGVGVPWALYAPLT